VAGWVLGIDFGTCFTCAAVARDGQVEMVPLPQEGPAPAVGSWRMPSMALLGEDGTVQVGRRAESMAAVFPERLVRLPKRALADGPVTLVAGKEVETASIVAAILAAAADEAIRHAGGQPPQRVVLTCPVLWGPEERARLVEAGERAGLGTADLIAEPEAAARFYAVGADGLAASPPLGSRVAVFDFGGGTLDIAVLERITDTFAPVGYPGGNPRLGGEDLDEALRPLIEQKVADAGGGAAWDKLWADTSRDARRDQRLLLKAITELKEQLAGEPDPAAGERASFAYIDVPLAGASPGQASPPISREEVASAIRPLVERAVGELARTIDAAQADVAGLAGIYLTGGSSQVSLLRRLIRERLGREAEQHGDPKSAVIRGALTELPRLVPPPQGWTVPETAIPGDPPVMFRGGPGRQGASAARDVRPGWEPWCKDIADEALSSPVVAGRRVYVASADGYLHARKAKHGKRVKDPGTNWPAKIGGVYADGVVSTPAVAGGVVYAGAGDGCLYAIDAVTGAELGRFPTGGPISSSPAVGDDGLVYVGSADGYLYAIDALTGTEAWRFGAQDEIHSSPAVADGIVYVGSDDGCLYAISAANGASLWKKDTDDRVRSSPAVSDGVVYFGSNSGRLYARDAASSEKVWTFKTAGKWDVRSSPAVSDGVVYFGADDGNVYGVDAWHGELLWKRTIGSDIWSSPVVAPSLQNGSGIVYIGSDDGALLALSTRDDGEQLWAYGSLDDPSSPCVADGVVYVTDDGDLYALNAKTGGCP